MPDPLALPWQTASGRAETVVDPEEEARKKLVQQQVLTVPLNRSPAAVDVPPPAAQVAPPRTNPAAQAINAELEAQAMVNAVAPRGRYTGPPTTQVQQTRREQIAARTPEEQAQVQATRTAQSEAQGQQIAQTEGAAETVREGSFDQQDALDRGIAEAEALDQARLEEAKRQEAELKDADGQVNDLVDRIGSGEADPNRLWKDASTGKKVGMVIGQVLGAIGAALQSGATGTVVRSQAADAIQQLIDQDLDAQRTDLIQMDKQLAGAKGSRAALRERTQESLRELGLKRGAALELAARRAESIAGRVQDQTKSAELMRTAAELRERKALALQDQLKERFGTTTEQTTVSKRSGGMRGGGMRKQLLKAARAGIASDRKNQATMAREQFKARLKAAKGGAETVVPGMDHDPSVALSNTEKKDARDERANYLSVKARIRRMRGLLQDVSPVDIALRAASKASGGEDESVGATVLRNVNPVTAVAGLAGKYKTDRLKQIDANAANITLGLQSMIKGNPNASEMQKISDWAGYDGDIADLVTGQGVTGMDELEAQIDQAHEAKMESLGLTPNVRGSGPKSAQPTVRLPNYGGP